MQRRFDVPDDLEADGDRQDEYRQMAEKIGARLTIRSAPRQGTTVVVALRPSVA